MTSKMQARCARDGRRGSEKRDIGHTRTHLDEVEGLGQFVELEVVLQAGQSPAEGEKIARDLMRQLDIRDEDLIDKAYIDLLESESGAG